MRITIYVSLLSFLFLSACQQQTSNSIEQKEKVYDYALKNGDYYVATQAVYDILSTDEEANVGWKDTLALLYFNRNLPAQTLIVSNEVLSKKPNDLRMLECSAISYQALGSTKEALETYEKLYAQSADLNHLYQIASLQYSLKRYPECITNLDKIATDPKVNETTVSLIFNKTNQEVPMGAAIRNMFGVIAKEEGNSEGAQTAFQEALKIFPEFKLAQGNLDALK